MALYADIIIDISLEKLDRTFQYLVPEELEQDIGDRNAHRSAVWKRKQKDHGLCGESDHRTFL